MKYHLIKKQDEVDSEGYKQSKEPQVVEIPGQVVLEKKRISRSRRAKGRKENLPVRPWVEVCRVSVPQFLFF